ncbi:MAG: bifunctional pyr operon transcriptional regulator/uracil phosphoribosyltransferase PyrR [Gemmatimonadota bacterium]
MPAELTGNARTILDAEQAGRIIRALAEAIDARVPTHELLLVGIRRRGDLLAAHIAAAVAERRGAEVPTGSLDITLYRDDFAQVGPRPLIGTTRLPGEITGRHLVVVDDVLHTGRTIRAALNELTDFGRARRIELCVLIDRGGRELPIQPDYVGRHIEVPPGMEVSVRLPELDGALGVDLVPLTPGGA